MSHVEAVFRHGVFEPLSPVHLREEERVHISFQRNPQPIGAWLMEVEGLQASIVKRTGLLPDSSADIASDRRR